MDRYQQIKSELIGIKRDIYPLVLNAKSLPGSTNEYFSGWEKICETFEKEVSKDVIRVAVIGPIKSGKSTFVNALIKKDYLKRGAGVVTSIVTRIRSGRSLQATLYFKSWQEVNTDIQQALVLFPVSNWRHENTKFDIRHRRDRVDLQHALNSLTTEQMIINDARNPNSVLLTSYLKGYEKIKEILSSENTVIKFEAEQFHEHREFVGDDSLSVYLRDIQLDIDQSDIDGIMEIADCQGSDSSNPLHLAMIQDYLLLTHFLIYVINSRTGLRSADIRFLSMIKKMGIIENILFVINCDINAHEAMDDLKNLIARITEELAMIVPNPAVYTFSSLFNLFASDVKGLSPRDRQRLRQWKKQEEISAFCGEETKRFKSFFDNKMSKEKSFLLLKNHLERLDVVINGLQDWARIHQQVLFRQEDSTKDIIEKASSHREKLNQVKAVIKNTLDGALPKIEGELKQEIDRFFDIGFGGVVRGVVDFIRNYTVAAYKFEENLKKSGFSNTLYLTFHEFKCALDGFIVETANPEIIRFVGEREKRIIDYFKDVANPYVLMTWDALHEYKDTMAALGVKLTARRRAPAPSVNIDSIRAVAGLKIPPASTSIHYTAQIRSEAIMRLGFYSAVKALKKILKKPLQGKNEEEVNALKDSIMRIKRETEKSILAHFADYKENVKFQYVFKLVSAVKNHFNSVLREHLKACSSDLSVIIEMVNNQRIDQERISKTVTSVEENARSIVANISDLRERLN